jgi:hypothetical protein
VFDRLHRAGRPGAFANGALSLVPGAAIVAGHGGWSWPGAVLTCFGWLLVIKGLICFLLPDMAVRSMARGPSRAGDDRRGAHPDGTRRLGRVLSLARRWTRLNRECSGRAAAPLNR